MGAPAIRVVDSTSIRVVVDNAQIVTSIQLRYWLNREIKSAAHQAGLAKLTKKSRVLIASLLKESSSL